MIEFDFLERIVADERAIIYVRDLDGRYLWVNDTFRREVPVDMDSLMGRTNRELFGEEAARNWESGDAMAIAANTFIITPEELYDTQRRRWRKFLSTKDTFTIADRRYLVGVSVELLDADAERYERKLAEFRARLIERFGKK